ncbi:DUF3017 domain-containing protein [Streptomyces sp. NPDC048338]|uniref:DUF3017 domain-containing protein n=1 Tax=Streptomyces sp. NPDC048338 TaxID=3365536 RepID=UPI003711D7F8
MTTAGASGGAENPTADRAPGAGAGGPSDAPRLPAGERAAAPSGASGRGAASDVDAGAGGTAPAAPDASTAPDGSDASSDSTAPDAPADGADGTEDEDGARGRSRRPPAMTTGTVRPEGGGRAAPGDAPAPARQWPLLTVLGLAGLGLLVVGADLFPQSFRVGTILVGVALLTGAALRRALPSVGMLAVRSRFTDLVTYGLMGALIVLLALMVQPDPWLRIPFLEDILHLTVT